MGEDRTNTYNPYMYLAGVVSLGPTKCGTAGYPGNMEFLHFISLLFAHAFVDWIEELITSTYFFLFITFRCIHGNECIHLKNWNHTKIIWNHTNLVILFVYFTQRTDQYIDWILNHMEK